MPDSCFLAVWNGWFQPFYLYSQFFFLYNYRRQFLFLAKSRWKMIRVLIVDDEYIMRQGLKYMIDWGQEGYEIVGEAATGKDALGLVEELMPHIIICDIVMPLLDGVDFSEVLHKMYPAIQIIILSGYDNFEYVKQTLMNGAVDYILKPALNPGELVKALQKASERIPGYRLQKDSGTVSYERFMERYLLGHDKVLDKERFQPYFTHSRFCIYAVNIKKINKSGQELSGVLYKKIEREVSAGKDFEKLLVMLREELVCIIFCCSVHQRKDLIFFIEHLNEQLTLLCDSVLGVCSREFAQLEQVYQVYQQDIIRNVDKAFYYENQKLLFVEEQEPEGAATALKFDFFQYNYYLEEGQFQKAIRNLEQYNELALHKQMDAGKLKNQIKNMVYHFLDTLRIDDQKREECRYTCFKIINEAEYEEAYRQGVRRVWNHLLELSGTSLSQNDERIERILEYIACHYQEDLKLETLSERFNFNYHYLSSYFSQQVQEGFSEYLNRVRIAKACQLLRSTDDSIAVISAEVGYADHSYFSRVFKKITGKTPSVWRRGRSHEE